MTLQTLLLELDAREEKYPGIKKGELVKDYKIRIAKEKENKSAQNAKYRAIQKSIKWHIEDFDIRRKVAAKLPKVKNEMFTSVDTNISKNVSAIMETIYPVTKKISPKLKRPVSFENLNGVKYWTPENDLLEDCLDILNREIKAYLDDNMTESQLAALLTESTTYDEIAKAILINE